MTQTGTISPRFGDGFEPIILIGQWSRSESYVSGFGMRPCHEPERGWTRYCENHEACAKTLGRDTVPKILWGAERHGQPGPAPGHA